MIIISCFIRSVHVFKHSVLLTFSAHVQMCPKRPRAEAWWLILHLSTTKEGSYNVSEFKTFRTSGAKIDAYTPIKHGMAIAKLQCTRCNLADCKSFLQECEGVTWNRFSFMNKENKSTRQDISGVSLIRAFLKASAMWMLSGWDRHIRLEYCAEKSH